MSERNKEKVLGEVCACVGPIVVTIRRVVQEL